MSWRDRKALFIWYDLMTTDVAAAKVFYGKVVGWTMHDMAMPDMTYSVVQVGDKGIGGMMPLPKDAKEAGAQPAWLGYIYAADVDQAAAKLQELGGKIHHAPTDIPEYRPFCRGSRSSGSHVLFVQTWPAGRESSFDRSGKHRLARVAYDGLADGVRLL